jgi:hypothetical protein
MGICFAKQGSDNHDVVTSTYSSRGSSGKTAIDVREQLAWGALTRRGWPQDLIEEKWALMDKDGSGSLSLAELKSLLVHMNVTIADKTLASKFAEFDSSKDGTLSMDEFRHFFASVSDKPGPEIDEVGLKPLVLTACHLLVFYSCSRALPRRIPRPVCRLPSSPSSSERARGSALLGLPVIFLLESRGKSRPSFGLELQVGLQLPRTVR